MNTQEEIEQNERNLDFLNLALFVVLGTVINLLLSLAVGWCFDSWPAFWAVLIIAESEIAIALLIYLRS